MSDKLQIVKVTHHVHTEETPASSPARKAALQAIADAGERQLCLFHWQKLEDIVSSMQHGIRDYSDETSPLSKSDSEEVTEQIDKAMQHLALIRDIMTEAAANGPA